MEWTRTLRLDEELEQTGRDALAAAGRTAGARRVEFGSPHLGRTYAAVVGPANRDPVEVMEALAGRAYAGAIIALAIELRPVDALQPAAAALAGAGAPAGVIECERVAQSIVVEIDPQVSPVSLVLRVIDVELRRFAGTRTVRVLTPLTPEQTARVAADGLGAPEIAPDRILEGVLDRAGVR